MASFSELANLSADVIAKVEDSKEARPAMRPEYGRNCYAGALLEMLSQYRERSGGRAA